MRDVLILCKIRAGSGMDDERIPQKVLINPWRKVGDTSVEVRNGLERIWSEGSRGKDNWE